MKVSDYIIQFITKLGVGHIFTVAGAGNVHLLDSMRRNEQIEYICNHHEQACAMAMYAYSRVTENFGVCIVTTGPGATNAITGVCSAWVDSIPGLIISGQVKTSDTIRDTGVRQFGIQEINIVEMVTPITKYAVMVRDPQMIRYELEKAVYLAREGRPGPSWLDIPLNVQAAQVDPDKLTSFPVPPTLSEERKARLREQAQKVIQLINASERPIILAGHGIRLANALPEYAALINKLQIPVLTTWNAIDLMPSDHELYVGRPGIYGQRGANFAIQNSDFFLSIGSRLSIPQVGYDYSQFARAAKKVYVDIDPHEINKFPTPPDITVAADAKEFIDELLAVIDTDHKKHNIEPWKKRCSEWRDKYPVDIPEYAIHNNKVNIFHFISVLSEELSDDELIIPTASGSGFTSSHQALKIKQGQRCFTSNGFAEMGFDVPGAIGACIGANRKRVVTVTGDGGVQMNIQEFQTIIHHNLPIKLFILNNNGYLTIRHTENALFNGNQSGTDPETGVSIPDIQKIGQAYGFKTFQIVEQEHMRETIRKVLDEPGPVICEMVMDPNQPLVPKTSFKQLPDGRMISPPIEDLFPFLDREEFLGNMIIPVIQSD
jgi:acetolactate synthase I/II/III large subunit